jgi:hypothetical protein
MKQALNKVINNKNCMLLRTQIFNRNKFKNSPKLSNLKDTKEILIRTVN